MKKLLIYTIIFMLINSNFSYSASRYNKFLLIEAVKQNNLLKTKKYIKEKYRINLKDKNGNTALTYSIRNNNFEITKLLLRAGADPAIKDSSKKQIYCSGKTSENYRIKRLFEIYNNKNCQKDAIKKNSKNKRAKMELIQESESFWNFRTLGLGALTIGGIIALASASGGGGGDDNPIFPPADTDYELVGQVNETALESVINNVQYSGIWDNEYSNFNKFNKIRLAYSLARGYTGKYYSALSSTPYYINSNSTSTAIANGTKIKVAILDSGVLVDHIDLVSNITGNLSGKNMVYSYCQENPSNTSCILGGYVDDPNPTSTNNNPTSWHGTFVAGIIGASYSDGNGITGIAPESEIIPYRLTFNNGSFVGNKYIGNAFKSASDNGAVVINNSYGYSSQSNFNASTIENQEQLVNIFKDSNSSSYSNYLTQMINAVKNKDVIFVWAAGNDGQAQPSVESAIPLFYQDTFKEGQYYKNFINVVSYDTETDALADYSNHCGVAKEYCITAPGSDIISTVSGANLSSTGLYGIASGTSFSAPMVSGAVAVIKGAFPYLTGAEITKLLFITARDLGEPGLDEVYGWGMLDLERATRPVGATVVPINNTVATAGFGLTESKIKLSLKFANNIKSKNLNFVILDSFNRTFVTKLNDFIESEKDRVDTIDILRKFGGNNITMEAIDRDKSFNLYSAKNPITEKYNEFEFSYSPDSVIENNYGFNVYYGVNPYNAFIDNKLDFYNNYSLSNSYEYNALNPFFKNNSDINFSLNNIIKLNEKSSLNFGVLYQNYTINYDKYYDNRKKNEDLGTSFSFLSGLDYNITKNINTKLELGLINEEETLFGSKFNGAFNVGKNNLTYITSLQNSLNLFKNKLSLFGKSTFGYTHINQVKNSLIKDISGLYSNSFTFGINYNFKNNFKGEKSNISLLFTQPVKINSGNIKLSLPVARDMDGNLYYSNHKISLRDKQETNLQLTYNYLIKNDKSFNIGLMYRNYLDNEYIFLLKYKKAFSF